MGRLRLPSAAAAALVAEVLAEAVLLVLRVRLRGGFRLLLGRLPLALLRVVRVPRRNLLLLLLLVLLLLLCLCFILLLRLSLLLLRPRLRLLRRRRRRLIPLSRSGRGCFGLVLPVPKEGTAVIVSPKWLVAKQ
jgi:hypothetical protein